jgi:two-component system sensor histidine kinase HydH
MMKRKLASVSPWILAAACTLLAVIIGVFAVSNYSREKKLMTEALLQKGLAVIRFLDTGVRVSMRANWQNLGGSGYNWVDHVQSVIDQIHDQQDIHYVELINVAGTVLAGSDRKRLGRLIEEDTRRFIELGEGGDPVFRMVTENGHDHQGFQVALQFKPSLRGPMQRNNQRGRNMMERMFNGQPGAKRMQEEFTKLQDQQFALLVELDLEQFNNAVERQLWQIVILSVVLLLVGVGGWLSLLTLQGFKGTQSRLQRIRAFNDMLVESLPVGLIATDAAGDIQVVNAAAERITGMSAEKLLAQQPERILPPELAQSFHALTRQPNQPQSSESAFTSDVDGRTCSLLLTVLPVVDDAGLLTGEVLLIQDISEIRALESQLRRNERLAALGKMAAGVAHELRNPLSSIKGLAVLLKGKVGADREGKQTADILVEEVERLNRSICELLDYTRPEKLEKTRVPLSGILDKARTLVGVDAESLGITISLLSDATPGIVVVDEDKMNQVFLNLLLNSIQAMHDGGELIIGLKEEAGVVVCTIEDTGTGVSEENLSKVFDPYFTTKSDGTGLGLALSAKIVEEHGGSIALENRRPEGVRVTIRLPKAA